MTGNLLILLIALPFVTALGVQIIPAKIRFAREFAAAVASFACLAISLFLFGKEAGLAHPWLGAGIDISFRLYHFSSFLICAVNALAFLAILYSASSLSGKPSAKHFFVFLLLNLGFAQGAVLAGNLITMLFFWEGSLVTLFAMIAIGGNGSFKTAKKALVISGLCDLCLMLGIGIYGKLAGSFAISGERMGVSGLGGAAFILMMIGAIGKTGAMPFHSWIPDAGTDAPLPFMAIIPGSLDKLIGIYLLTRISLDLFARDMHSWASITLMTVGAATIIFAVMMALVQKDYKRLLAYHAISQAGYMVLGIGTFTAAGILGGLFHMLNNAIYKCALFMTGGSVEKQAGTTDLERLGGLARNMPYTFAFFLITAASIAGVPPLNGFFSKELIYSGALSRGSIFYLAAAAGTFLTAASFLKLGHAAYLGKRHDSNNNVKESSALMLGPMLCLALSCVLLGLNNSWVVRHLFEPVLGEGMGAAAHHEGAEWNSPLVMITIAVLAMALLNHAFGVIRTKRALGACDHIHHAPVLSWFYDKAEKGYFDPYNIWYAIIRIFSLASSAVDRAIDRLYNDLIPRVTGVVADMVKNAHTGSYRLYIIWALAASSAILILLVKAAVKGGG